MVSLCKLETTLITFKGAPSYWGIERTDGSNCVIHFGKRRLYISKIPTQDNRRIKNDNGSAESIGGDRGVPKG